MCRFPGRRASAAPTSHGFPYTTALSNAGRGERDAGCVPNGTKYGVIQRIAAVVTFPVFDHRHHVPVGAAGFEDGSGQFPVGQLDVAVDVVDPPRSPRSSTSWMPRQWSSTCIHPRTLRPSP